MPRPQIVENKAALRMAYAVSPSFSSMSDAQLNILLAEARQVALDHFGIELEFSQPEEISISQLFALHPNFAEDDVLQWVYYLKVIMQNAGGLWRICSKDCKSTMAK